MMAFSGTSSEKFSNHTIDKEVGINSQLMKNQEANSASTK
jgi:hypothetical protein